MITGAKHKALFAMLATAPFGRRTRPYLQETLWGTACYDTGRQSLRRALSDIKQIMGDQFSQLFGSTNSDVTLDVSKVRFVGRPGSGTFLEGLDLREEGFNRWLDAMRANPEQLYALYSATTQAPSPSVLPLVAIIPFRTIGGSDQHAVLGDWLAEEVCRSLSRSSFIAVISHLSSRSLNGRHVDIALVRSTLAANYCVAGSLRADGNEIILDADFIDTESGRILWTRQFAGTVADFLRRSSEGVTRIVSAVGRSIADDAINYVRGKSPADLAEHRLLVAGISLMHRPALRDFARSRELVEEVLRRAPNAAEALAWYGRWHVLSVFNGWSVDPAKDTRIAVDSTARALDIDPENAFCLTIDGFAHNNLLRRLDIAGARYDAALRNNPNESLSWLLKGAMHAFKDEAQEAVSSVETARRLSPIDPFQYYYESLSATALLAAERYEEALALADASLLRHDRHLSTLRVKITALHFLGRATERAAAGAELLRLQPGVTVAAYLKNHPSSDHQFGRNVAAALGAAGIP